MVSVSALLWAANGHACGLWSERDVESECRWVRRLRKRLRDRAWEEEEELAGGGPPMPTQPAATWLLAPSRAARFV